MSELPILFSGPMVRAILDGRKTMTRRVAIPRYDDRTPCEHLQGDNSGMGPTMFRHCCHGSEGRGCPHGVVGDRLWVRETWRPAYDEELYCCVEYRADGKRIKPENGSLTEDQGHKFADDCPDDPALNAKWRPSIFMPRWASRITLEIVSVKVERVQEITEKDAIAEGIPYARASAGTGYYEIWDGKKSIANKSAANVFAVLWDSINAKRGFGWGVNPWTWAITFKRIK